MMKLSVPNLSTINPHATGYKRSLLAGEAYEQALCDAINKAYPNLRAFRPNQTFLPWDCETYWKARLARPELTQDRRYRLELAKLDETTKERLRPQQSDVWVRSGKTITRLEVKALTPAAFRASLVHFGRVEKFDQKIRRDWLHYGAQLEPWDAKYLKPKLARAIPFDAVVLINDDTGEAFVTPHWTRWELSADLWGKTTSRQLPDDSQQALAVLDYACLLADLEPLDNLLKTL